MKKHTMTRGVVAAGLLATLALSSTALSQPARGNRAQNGDQIRAQAGPRDGQFFSRDRVRAMAEKRLADLEQREADLHEILALVDSDASDDAIRTRVHELMQDARNSMGPWGDRPNARGGGPGAGLGAGPGGPPGSEFLEHIDPRLHQHFERMRARNPERAEALLQKAGPRLERLENLRETDPERFEARAQAMRSIHDAMQAAHAVVDAGTEGLPQSEIDALKAEFMAKVGIAVDAGIALREMELVNAEERLTNLREEVEHMQDSRDEVVQKHAEEMLARAARREVGAASDDTWPRGPRGNRRPE
jgi:ElaB/YqjD/DUF883 family membrane-anchored ribosome-binding protein